MKDKDFVLKHLYFQNFKEKFEKFWFNLRFSHLTYIYLHLCVYLCAYVSQFNLAAGN